jgi:hypothetical protein
MQSSSLDPEGRGIASTAHLLLRMRAMQLRRPYEGSEL